MQRHYDGQYDKVLFSHDDNYMLNDTLFSDILECKVDLFLNVELNKINQVENSFEIQADCVRAREGLFNAT